MSLVNFFNDISTDIHFASYNVFNVRIGESASFGSDVNFGLTFSVLDRDIDKVSVGDGPYSLVLHIIDSVDILNFVKNFYFEEHRINFGE